MVVYLRLRIVVKFSVVVVFEEYFNHRVFLYRMVQLIVSRNKNKFYYGNLSIKKNIYSK